MLNWLPADASVLCRHGEDCMKGEKFEKNFKDERGNKNRSDSKSSVGGIVS